MELFLAKLFGLYFIIIGSIILVRRNSVMPTIARFASDRALLLTIAVIEIAAGLGLVLALPRIGLDMTGLISLIGYMLIVESLIYLAAPARFVRKMIGSFNKPIWYVIGGTLSVCAGLYLAGKGFGYF